MICPHCGATLPDGSASCRSCGAKLETEEMGKTQIVVENLESAGKTSVIAENMDKTQLFSEGLESVAAFYGWLVIVEGPDQWKEFHLPDGMDQLLIGRGEASDLRLNDEGLARIHASLRKKEDKFFLADLDTESGTRVNGNPVERVELHDGDLIQIGNTSIKFKLL